MIKFRRRVLNVLLTGCLLAACGCTRMVQSLTQASGDAQKLEADTHAAMARGDWKSLYENGAPELHEAATEEKFGALFTAIQKKLGAPISSTPGGWRINSTTSGTFLYADCETTFKNNAKGTESFTWKKIDGVYKLAAYHINSDELIER